MRERGRSNRAVGLTHAGQRVSGRRRLPAGESRRGGARRDRATDHGLERCWVLWRVGAEPRVWVVELDQMVAGIDAGDEVCDGRGSAIDENGATEH